MNVDDLFEVILLTCLMLHCEQNVSLLAAWNLNNPPLEIPGGKQASKT